MDTVGLAGMLVLSQELLWKFGLSLDCRQDNRLVLILDRDGNRVIEWNTRSGNWMKNGGGKGITSNYFEILSLCLRERALADTVIERNNP